MKLMTKTGGWRLGVWDQNGEDCFSGSLRFRHKTKEKSQLELTSFHASSKFLVTCSV